MWGNRLDCGNNDRRWVDFQDHSVDTVLECLAHRIFLFKSAQQYDFAVWGGVPELFISSMASRSVSVSTMMTSG